MVTSCRTDAGLYLPEVEVTEAWNAVPELEIVPNIPTEQDVAIQQNDEMAAIDILQLVQHEVITSVQNAPEQNALRSSQAEASTAVESSTV